MEQLTIFNEIYQPRFQAYLNYTGKTHKSEVNNGKYMAWIGRNIREYRRLNEIGKIEPLSDDQHEEFTKILFKEPIP